MIKRINYLQDTYYNIEALNNENKEKVLYMLNDKYELNYSMGDVWSRPKITTAGNQFLYFKNHLITVYSDIFYADGNTIIKKANSDDKIKDLIEKTQVVEQISSANECIEYYFNQLY